HGTHLEAACGAIRQPQHIVVKAVLLIPHAARAGVVHARGDKEKVVDELDHHVREAAIDGGDLDRELDHVLTEERHPRRAVGLLEVATRGQRRTAVEYPDVVESEKAALEDALASAILAVYPPVEVELELEEGALEE